MKKDIQLVIFDCDGVVVDSEIISAHVLVNQLQKIGISIDSAYVMQHFLGCNFATVKKHLAEYFPIALPTHFEEVYREALLLEFEQQLTTTPGFAAMLEKLNIPYCIATSSSPQRTAKALKLVGLETHFSGRVFTASEVKNGKPAPDLFLHAAKQMSVEPSHCLVLEDSPAGIQAGLSANMQVVNYRGGAHLKAQNSPAEQPQQADFTIFNWPQFAQLCASLFTIQEKSYGHNISI
ncbi:HAD family hydrolase [Catenovulum sediminis]|uniref:HAD family hydrolase n=1 Tax=Catenovulum sediminis TaxID=1740262 RepID=A0ABV1RCK2_9ALTE